MRSRYRHLRANGGFSTLELILSACLLTLVIGTVATMLNNMAKGRVVQLDVSEIQQNQRYAMDMILRQVRGAGNDPEGTGFEAFDMDPQGDGQHTAIRIRSDFNPPNGVITDALEDVTFALSGSTLTFLDASTGSTTEVAPNISRLQFEYFNESGAAAASSGEVTRVRVTLTGASSHQDPNTGQLRTMTLTDETAVRNRVALGGGAADQGILMMVSIASTTPGSIQPAAGGKKNS